MKQLLTLLLLGCGAVAPAAEPCAPEGNLQFICGVDAVEDLVQVGNTRWLLGSGLGGADRPGTLVLVDTALKQAEVIYPSRRPLVALDSRRFPDCPSPPDQGRFNAHGITLRATGSGRFELLVVNHGGREAIEFFDVNTRGARPQMRWVGCVLMPPDTFMNSLDTLPDGGFVTTHFHSPSQGGMAAIFRGEITGGLFEWRPGRPVTGIPDTRLSGANGILLSRRGEVIHVAAWGSRELVRFERRGGTITKKTVAVDFAPDNLRWTSDGRLLVAGQKFAPPGDGPVTLEGWKVAVFDPDSLAQVNVLKEVDGSASFQAVSSAVEVGNEIWVGPFRGDRIGYFPRPR